MISTKLAAAKVLLLLVILTSPAAAQQKDGETAPAAPKSGHVFTNDDVGSGSSPSDDGPPPSAPGMIQCGTELRCFVQALDKAAPATITRVESVEKGTAVLTSESTWWTTQFSADRCAVSLRVDSFAAKLNESAVAQYPQAAREEAEKQLVAMNRDFQNIRGKTGTCILAVKDLRALMTSSSWTLMSLGTASNYGKTCSGPSFEGSNPLSNGQK